MLVFSVTSRFPGGQVLIDDIPEVSSRFPERRQRNVFDHGFLGDVLQATDNTTARFGRPQQIGREPVWPFPLFVQPIDVGLMDSKPGFFFNLRIRLLHLRRGNVDLEILFG